MHQRILGHPVIWSDDTRSRFAKPGVRLMAHGHFWVTIGEANAPYSVFHFTTGYDAASGPDRFLHGYIGYLHTDCLPQYNGLLADGVKHVACFAHARRKLLDAGEVATPGVELIHRLYHIDH